MTIGVCTDSNAQLPPELVERYAVEVVPITVRVDDCEYLEGVDLGADEFYERFTNGEPPVVTTTHPSPGQFALAYDELAERGCTQILSIHVAASLSGTLNSARLAAHSSPIPVRLVDSATAGFGVSCCVWAAAEALEAGATLEEASAIAESLASTIGNVFIVRALDHLHLSRATLHLDHDLDEVAPEGIPVLSLQGGQVHVVERVATLADAINAMSSRAVCSGDRVRVAVGVADHEVAPLGDALADAVGEAASVVEVVRYRIGPSIGAHTGPGTVGCFMFGASPARSTPAAS